MRVISGSARGCKLTAPSGQSTRPTGDRMKEDLFNILSPVISGSRFLDCYCGSGAIGIEALSRGASYAAFVDCEKEAIAVTKTNLQKARLEEKAEIFHATAAQALKKLEKFDIIFMDPPYESGELAKILAAASGLLTENGILVAECPLDIQLPELADLSIYRQKKYAQMQFIFYEKHII